MAASDRDEIEYVLGTDDGEIRRLGLQHSVWRDHARAAWEDAGFAAADSLADIGCGPGFATIELAAIAGPRGAVTAYDISERFLAFARERLSSEGLKCTTVQMDMDKADLGTERFDGIWCRWVASFVSRPRELVAAVAKALKPGGAAVMHEYLHYGTWRLLPRVAEFEALVEAIQQSWRDTGGEPDIATRLPQWLEDEGLEVQIQPLQFASQAGDPMWRWPAAFVESSLERLQQLDVISPDQTRGMRKAWEKASANPQTRMITPCLASIIARKRAA